MLAATRCRVHGAHFSLPVSEIHLRAWKKDRDVGLADAGGNGGRISRAVSIPFRGRAGCLAGRPGFLLEFAQAAEAVGLCRLRIADTVGILNPLQTAEFFHRLRAAVPELSLEFHGHNDLGMATANTIAALASGADAASVTVNGLGERAGNAPLDEVVMAARLTWGRIAAWSRASLPRLGDLVARASGRPLAPEKPVTGAARIPARIGHSLQRLAGKPRHLRAVRRRGRRPHTHGNGGGPAFRHAPAARKTGSR